MLQRKKNQLLFLLILLAFSAFPGNSVNNAGNDSVKMCVTQDETILFNLINDMRRQNKLPSIPLSFDLCIVAQTHILDLIKWKPQEKGCSLHSWSGSGKWTPCCNTKEVFGIQCMKSKPREITAYPGDGYELIYWGEDNATPADAAALWKQLEASSDMILNRAKWSGYQWQAIGVGIKAGYAVLWLGDTKDKNLEEKSGENTPGVQQPAANNAVIEKSAANESVRPKPAVNQKEATVSSENSKQPANEPGIKCCLIVGSYTTIETANTELAKIKLKYPSSYVREGNSVFRIVIASFDTVDQATKMKNELKETFPGIWILKK